MLPAVGNRSVLFATMELSELRSLCLPPLCHLLHDVLFKTSMWYLMHPTVQFRSAGLELLNQR